MRGTKKQLDNITHNDELYFREGDMWWCALGVNIGTESLGKGAEFRRPVYVLKKFSTDSCICIALTSKEKTGTWFVDISLQGERRYALMHQIRMIHKKRFQRKISELDEQNARPIKKNSRHYSSFLQIIT